LLVESLTKKLESSEETVKKLTSEQSLLNEKLQGARTERDRKHVGYSANISLLHISLLSSETLY